MSLKSTYWTWNSFSAHWTQGTSAEPNTNCAHLPQYWIQPRVGCQMAPESPQLTKMGPALHEVIVALRSIRQGTAHHLSEGYQQIANHNIALKVLPQRREITRLCLRRQHFSSRLRVHAAEKWAKYTQHVAHEQAHACERPVLWAAVVPLSCSAERMRSDQEWGQKKQVGSEPKGTQMQW